MIIRKCYNTYAILIKLKPCLNFVRSVARREWRRKPVGVDVTTDRSLFGGIYCMANSNIFEKQSPNWMHAFNFLAGRTGEGKSRFNFQLVDVDMVRLVAFFVRLCFQKLILHGIWAIVPLLANHFETSM